MKIAKSKLSTLTVQARLTRIALETHVNVFGTLIFHVD